MKLRDHSLQFTATFCGWTLYERTVSDTVDGWLDALLDLAAGPLAAALAFADTGAGTLLLILLAVAPLAFMAWANRPAR